MKKILFLFLLLGLSNALTSQQYDYNLNEIFDSGAFAINVPDTWKEIEPAYPFRHVKKYVLKDSLYNGYFTIGQFEIKEVNNFNLKDIVKRRVRKIKKNQRKFTSDFKRKESDYEKHYVLETSWRNRFDKKKTSKHITEYLKKGNLLYIFRYSDSTNSSPEFIKEAQNVISSLKLKRKAKDLFTKKVISKKQLNNYLKDYTLKIPKNWFGFISETGELQFTPIKFNQEKYTRNRNVFFVKELSDVNLNEDTLSEFAQSRFNFINSTYRSQKSIKKEIIHKKYGKYYLIQYSSRVWIKDNYLSSTKATVLEALILHNKRKYILTYYFENHFFNDYIKDVISMINSFKIKEPIQIQE